MQIIKNIKPKITIIDYQLSNLFSINNALLHLGFNSLISNNLNDLNSSDGLILPGVGSFPEAMKNLKRLKLIDSIEKFVSSNKPLMGICLGMQLLFDESEEINLTNGLGITSGKVIYFKRNSGIKIIPHTGWNNIEIFKKNKNNNIKLFEKKFIIKLLKEKFYFVHSFYAVPKYKSNIFSLTQYYGLEFCSSIINKNIFACQFHPEKSGKIGLKLIKTFFNSAL